MFILGKTLVACGLLLAGLNADLASAESSSWRPVGPFGGSGGALAAGANGVLYFGSSSLYSSQDGALHWREVNASVIAEALAVDPRDPRHLMAVLLDPGSSQQTGGFESRDGGEHFTTLGLEPDRGLIYQLLFAPTDSAFVLAATESGLLRREGVQAWRRIELPEHGTVTRVAVSPADANLWLVTVFNAEATRIFTLRTDDGGVTWHRIAPTFGARILFDPRDARRVYGMDYSYGFFVSDDAGRTWGRVRRGIDGRYLNDLAIGPDGTLHAGTNVGLIASRAGGLHWRPEWNAGLREPVQAVVALPSGVLVASAIHGLWRAAGAAARWRPANDRLALHLVASLAVDANGAVYVGADGVLRSDDGGRHWSAVSQGLRDAFGLPSPLLAVAAGDPAVVYGAGFGRHGFARTSVRGEHWDVVGHGGSDPVTTLAVDPLDARTVYLGGPETNDHYERLRCHVVKTTDAGDSWQCLEDGDAKVWDARSIAIHPRSPNELLLATCCDFARSSNGGRSWRWIASSLGEFLESPESVAFVDDDPAHVALAAGGVLYLSEDAGETLIAAGAGLPAGARIASLVADGLRSGDLYAGVVRSDAYGQGLGVFVSHDSGRTFVALGVGLPTRFNGLLALDAERRVLYAGTSGRSVYRFDLPR